MSLQEQLEETLIVEPEETYHAQAGECLSSHLLITFAKCPLLYKNIVSGIHTPPDSQAYAMGRALHTYVLEGKDKFYSIYDTNEPINPTTGKPYGQLTKKWQEWQRDCRNYGKVALSNTDYTLVCAMANSIEEHHHAKLLLQQAPYRESVARCIYRGFLCQIRIDAFGESIGIVDLKTCDRITRFESSAISYGYFNQLAFYRAVLSTALKINYYFPVHIVAVEKQYPYRCGVWKLDSRDLDSAQEENEQDMRELEESISLGNWPTKYEDIRTLHL